MPDVSESGGNVTATLRNAVFLFSTVYLAGCNDVTRVSGAGATFPDPLYQEWIRLLAESRPGLRISYEPVGSALGVSRLLEGKIAFAGSDVLLTGDQVRNAKTGKLGA